MQRLVDGHRFADTLQTIGVIVPFVQLHQGKRVRTITVDLIGAGETAWGIPAEVARGHQYIQGPNRIHVKVVIRDGGGLVMRRLGRGMDDEIWPLVPEEIAHTLPVTNIQGVVPIVGEGGEQFLQDGPRCALRTKKLRPHVIVDPDDLPALTTEYARAL